jgi:uncharacterized ferritin-like protein (DUF455 family)
MEPVQAPNWTQVAQDALSHFKTPLEQRMNEIAKKLQDMESNTTHMAQETD